MGYSGNDACNLVIEFVGPRVTYDQRKWIPARDYFADDCDSGIVFGSRFHQV